MEKDNAIEKLVKLSKMFTTFVNITKKIIINKDMILHSVNQVKDYTVSFSLGSSKLLDKSEIELQEIIKDITENIHSISDSYFE
ncbi:hypothetical protein QAD20_002504, partial [Enterococcus faecium]|nr:hypothetical protein [Enterococcus faecium]